MLSGVISSTGVAFGKLLVLDELRENGASVLQKLFDSTDELKRFDEAVDKSKKELEKLRKEVRLRIGEDEEKIFEAQSLMLEDPLLIDEVKEKIIREKVSAEFALKQVSDELAQQMLCIDDDLISHRADDVRDISIRIEKFLSNNKSSLLEEHNEPVIIAAFDLLPSQAAGFDRNKVLGIAVEKGGINSHASIIARSLDIPAVIGIKDLLQYAGKARTAILDGINGNIIFDPDQEDICRYLELKALEEEKRKIDQSKSISGTVKTKNGSPIQIWANMGHPSEINKIKKYGIEGIGVFRTEFLLLDRKEMPCLEELAACFRTVLEALDPLPVNIRLFDLGADKTPSYLSLPHEQNPNLGCRGIRLLLSHKELLELQVKAILEAGSAGNVRIMLPMVSQMSEIDDFIKFLREIESEMSEQGHMIKTHIPVGMMIETPASALLSEHFARQADFFSVGTNDLTQYTLAADRDNESLQQLYNCLNPSVLILLKNAIQTAEKSGIEISVCGEMASNIRAVPILLGMGYNKLSMGVNRIPEIKSLIGRIEISRAKRLAAKALKAAYAEDVEKMAARFLHKIGQE